MCTTAASASDGEVFIGCALLQLQIPKVRGAAIRFKSMKKSLKRFFWRPVQGRPVASGDRLRAEVSRGEKMALLGTDPESFITECTLVYEKNTDRKGGVRKDLNR